jgi:DNA replication and repair protein RecF
LLDIEIPGEGIRLAGSNASGKRSFLEAIQLLATMRSARASVERELINWESNQDLDLPPYARLVGSFQDSTDMHLIEVSLAADSNRAGHTRKQIRMDGQPRRSVDAMGRFKTVLFEPEDMDLVLGSPANRRRFLDIALSSLDGVYLRTLSQYGKIVEQRNSLLKQLRESSSGSKQNRLGELAYWNEELIKRAAYLTVARIRLLDGLATPLQDSFRALLDDDHHLALRYVSAVATPDGFDERLIGTDSDDAQRRVIHWLESTLEERQDEELRRGVTVVGPHRDDLSFLLDGRELSSFGSRGQQRVAVVSLKLAEVEVDRKVLADLAITDPNTFGRLAEAGAAYRATSLDARRPGATPADTLGRQGDHH